MTDIFNEIENDIRRDRLDRLWRRFGPAIIVVAVLFVAAIAGWRLYDWYQQEQAQDLGDRFQQALTLSRDGKTAEAEAAMQAIATDASAGYEVLARFAAAGELAAKDSAVAAQRYDALAADNSIEPGLRDLARIRAALLLVDTAPLADIASRIEPLAAPDNPWRHAAREIMALSALRADDGQQAQRWAQELVTDQQAPQGSRARGQILLDLAAEPTGEAGEPAPAIPAQQ